MNPIQCFKKIFFYINYKITLQKNHEIETNFRDKKIISYYSD